MGAITEHARARRRRGETRAILSEPGILPCIMGFALVHLFRDVPAYATVPITTGDMAVEGLVLCCSRFLTIATFLAVLAVSRRRVAVPPSEAIMLGTPRLLAAALIPTLGIAILALPRFGALVPTDVYVIGWALFGVGNVLLITAFAEYLFHFDTSLVVGVFVIGSGAYGILRIALGFLSPSAALLLLVLCPSGGVLCLFEASGKLLGARRVSSIPPASLGAAPARPDKTCRTLCVGLFVWSLLFADMQGMGLGASAASDGSALLVQAGTGVGIAIGALLVWGLQRAIALDDLAVYAMMLPCLFVSLLCIGLTGPDAVPRPLFACALFVAKGMAYFLVWGLPLAKSGASDRLRVFWTAQLCTEGGLLAQDVLSLAVDVPQEASVFAFVAAALVVSATAAFELVRWSKGAGGRRGTTTDEPRTGLTSRSPYASGPSALVATLPFAGPFGDSVACAVAERYGLTPREREVAALLLANCSTQAMAEALTIAPTTVKTHVSNVYRKTGVGRRSELIALVRLLEA